MKLINLTDKADIAALAALTKRNSGKLRDVNETVEKIIDDVRANGDAALKKYAEKFDGCTLSSVAVTPEELDEAYASADPKLLDVLTEAKENIIAYHSRQKYAEVEIVEAGRKLYQRVTPIQRAGIYVPGGSYPYPSTVLMDTLPAVCAGVPEIVMITPAKGDGRVNKNILAAAKLCGVTEIYKSGGAQAIAALAYGTESIRPVHKICGPGNVYVTAAKRLVYGDVDIDMLAGPSEVLVIADEHANPVYVAADLLSQAEHDVNSACILITTSMALAQSVASQIELQLNELPTAKIARQSIENFGTIFIAPDIETAFEISNEIAPEHLELALVDPESYVELVKNAGTIFLGEYTPEPVGDYFAGTNHTIPTSGTAKFYSPLSAYDFMKRTSVVRYDRSELLRIGESVVRFAETEGLCAHANSIKKRLV